MKRRNKFQSRQVEETQAAAHQEIARETVREFGHADELLRHDSLHTPAPDSLAFRLQESIGPVPEKPRSWWRRLLGL